MLLEITAIKELGGVHITGLGKVCFLKGDIAWCTAICINELDFSVEFDQCKRLGLLHGNEQA